MLRYLQLGLLLSILLVAACDRQSRLPEYELRGSAMGTSYSVLLVDPAADVSKDELRSRIAATLERIENLLSTWRDNSELSKFNAAVSSDWISVSPELCGAIEKALEISRVTRGAFDITVGPLVNLWGFGPGGDVSEPPAEKLLLAAMSTVGFQELQTRCDKPAVRKSNAAVYVDLSAWAKGYAVDELAQLLDEYPLPNYLVEVGGELRVRGHNAEGLNWAVAIETPSTSQRSPQMVLRVTNTGVATSGDYRNFFDFDGKRYSHTIDARTGRPITHQLAAVTVVNESAAYADAMATALLVLGPSEGPLRAGELGVAALFLVRGDTSFQEITTPQFDLLGAI